MESREKAIAETIWAKEMLAQSCARTIETLWDELNRTTNKLALLRAFDCDIVSLGRWGSRQDLPHGITLQRTGAEYDEVKSQDWSKLLKSLENMGWSLDLVEFRHVRFETDAEGKPNQSRFYVSAHARNEQTTERVSLTGEVDIEWSPETAVPGELIKVARVDATRLTLARRAGPLVFQPVLTEQIQPSDQSGRIDPIILYDLDRDGLPEIILAARNLVYRNRGEFRFTPEPLCSQPEDFLTTALIADFDGDGYADLLGHKWEGTFLFEGSPDGHFPDKPRKIWAPDPRLRQPMVLTCGDIDADGDLDLFLGQYKEPYEGGTTPKPFFDANDGNPAYLLLNDGGGSFTDATESSGLVPKRFRRTYSASFADVDGDADLDLAVVSDFAGLDLYQNDGRGRFQDVTSRWIENPHAFGMAHSVTDFNNDARIDLLMIGMTSPTVTRLDHLGLFRATGAEEKSMRSSMTHGNRLYLSKPGGRFVETHLSQSIANSGWSWGSATLDFDNDGWVDFYIANGLESNSSVLDYEPEYWLHDRFIDEENSLSARDLYFKSKFSRTRSRAHSYGGYEINRFFLNLGGTNFFEAAYLLGAALQQDCRSALSGDLDGDGAMDLLVTTLEIWPKRIQRLHAFANTLETRNHWVGFHLQEELNAPSPVGTQLELSSDGQRTVRQIVTGDSYRSQHANTLHFGLGSRSDIQRLTIQIPTGEFTLSSPLSTKKYHRLDLKPAAKATRR